VAQVVENAGPAARVTPGEFLKRKMAFYGLTAATLAAEIDVHVQTIYNVTTGKRPISSKLAAKLARRFVEQVDVWLSDTIELTPVDASLATKPVKRSKAGGETSNVIEMQLFAKPAERSDGILIDREIVALLERPESGVSINPFDLRQVEPASYDLTMGIIVTEGFHNLSEYDWVSVLRYVHERETLSPRDRERIAQLLETTADLSFLPSPGSQAQSVTIGPLKPAVIIAREIVQFDKYHLADVGGTARNAINGLFVNHGFQIDPGYVGAMVFTALNIGARPLTLTLGQKLASLAIRRLHRPPEKAYHADIERSIRSLSMRLYDQIKAMFEYKALARGEFKASSGHFEETFVGSSLEDVQDNVVSTLLKDFSKGSEDISVSSGLRQAMHDAIDSVTVSRAETDALIRRFKIVLPEQTEHALSFFRMKESKQTLRDTLIRLGRDPIEGMVALLDDDDSPTP